MDTKKTRVIVTIVLVLMVPASMNYVTPLIAQTGGTGEDTSSASQDYQEFQSCLSDAEVDGSVSEQQIRDCFAPIYNTGTASGSDGPAIQPIALLAMKTLAMQIIPEVKMKKKAVQQNKYKFI